MSQQPTKSSPEREFNGRSRQDIFAASGTNSNGSGQEFGYASFLLQNSWHAQSRTVPSHQPTTERPYALLPHQVAQTNGDLRLVQAGYDVGAQYSYQSNDWNCPAFDANHLGEPMFDIASYDALWNFPNGGFEVGVTFPMAPAYVLDGIQDLRQPDMPITNGAQMIPAPFPTMVSAPPAPVAPTTIGRISCPRGCPATFGRGGDYRRHMRTHQAPRFRCPIVDCPKTFTRADKLRDHAKKGHRGLNPLNLE